jgi:hypothetical protein
VGLLGDALGITVLAGKDEALPAHARTLEHDMVSNISCYWVLRHHGWFPCSLDVCYASAIAESRVAAEFAQRQALHSDPCYQKVFVDFGLQRARCGDHTTRHNGPQPQKKIPSSHSF